jgi:hypothetical protein
MNADRPGPAATLEEAREWLKAAREEGTNCPCCNRPARVYRRKLNYAMAHGLILIYDYFATHDGWLHVPTFLNGKGVVARGGDLSKLTHWGLLVGSGEIRADDSSRVGDYKLTRRGIKFVEREIAVPAWLKLINNEVVERSDERVYIDAALGKFFNYAELMSGITRHPRPDPPAGSQTTFGFH